MADPRQFEMHETILEVKLDKPILPKSKVVFDMDFEVAGAFAGTEKRAG